MTYRADVKATCQKHDMSEDGANIVAAMMSSVHFLDDLMQGKTTDDVKLAGIQALSDFIFLFRESALMQRSGAVIFAAYALAFNAFLDAGSYAKEGDTDRAAAGQLITCRSAIYEVAVAVLLADKGAISMRENGAKLRDALTRLQ